MGFEILSQLSKIWLSKDDQDRLANWINTLTVETTLVNFKISLAAVLVPVESEEAGFNNKPEVQFETKPTIVIERDDPQGVGDRHRYNMFAIWDVAKQEIYIAQPAFMVEQVYEERGEGFDPLVHNVKVGLDEGYTNFLPVELWTQHGNEFQTLRHILSSAITNFGVKKVEKNI